MAVKQELLGSWGATKVGVRMGLGRDRRRRLRLGLIALFVSVVTALAALYIERRAGERSARFIERAEFFALAFADRAALYLSQGKQEELALLAQTVALGNTLYILVFAEGQLVVDARGPLGAGLELLPQESSLSTARLEGRSTGGLNYLEVTRPLPQLGPNAVEGSVRLGTSLRPLEQEIRSEILFIAALSLLLSASGAALILYLSRAPTAAPAEGRQDDRPGRPPGGARPPLVLDDAAKEASFRGSRVELSPREFELLRLLASAPGRVFSNREILEAVWKGEGFASAKDVKQYVYLLRRKLEEDPQHPRLIVTVRGFGYKLNSGK